ncbi:hypothetical protein SAMN05216474_2436 [Lishizhenia tianjinensis]|uniref:Uncharacterized protein n=1 Tax=Lishizhenia tianjinensis TaxID=477690 RepID=A0A1I7B0A9_9FLAO|nr:hypothetical protein [Lishizhenia tianjinensis]SFT80619.1 hypothetical protein SAMN05216474_2436 [Lishizhenia tianjinensis]
MNKYILPFVILALGVSACRKDNSFTPSQSTVELKPSTWEHVILTSPVGEGVNRTYASSLGAFGDQLFVGSYGSIGSKSMFDGFHVIIAPFGQDSTLGIPELYSTDYSVFSLDEMVNGFLPFDDKILVYGFLNYETENSNLTEKKYAFYYDPITNTCTEELGLINTSDDLAGVLKVLEYQGDLYAIFRAKQDQSKTIACITCTGSSQLPAYDNINFRDYFVVNDLIFALTDDYQLLQYNTTSNSWANYGNSNYEFFSVFEYEGKVCALANTTADLHVVELVSSTQINSLITNNSELGQFITGSNDNTGVTVSNGRLFIWGYFPFIVNGQYKFDDYLLEVVDNELKVIDRNIKIKDVAVFNDELYVINKSNTGLWKYKS